MWSKTIELDGCFANSHRGHSTPDARPLPFRAGSVLQSFARAQGGTREFASQVPTSTLPANITSYGRGAGVGRGLGVGASLGVGVGLGVDVGVGVGLGVAVAAAVAVGVAVGVDVAVEVAVAVGVAVGVTVGVAVGVGLAVGVGVEVAVGLDVGVGVGVATAAQYLPPVFKGPRGRNPPQTIIWLPVHTAVG